jgi:molybdate transport system substrate-binding protein
MRLNLLLKTSAFAVFITVCCFLGLNAQNLVIASGAGYKKPVTEIIENFEKQYHVEVDAIFGNLQMVASQARESGEVACIIGDKKFLARLGSTVSFADYTPMGKGIIVLAYRKGITLDKLEDIVTDKVKSLFMPQSGKAIYGVAGKETLESLGYMSKVSDKLTQVATVPQVLSYLLTGEADAGFINLTEALANKDKIGGYIIVPEDAYKPIEIVSGTVTGFENKELTRQFVSYLDSETAKVIIKKHGL